MRENITNPHDVPEHFSQVHEQFSELPKKLEELQEDKLNEIEQKMGNGGQFQILV